MSELRPCPFCGSEAEHQYSKIDHMNIYRCSSSKCITRRFDWYLRDDWNTRPIEDVLREKLSLRDYKYVELASINDRFKTELDECKEELRCCRLALLAKNSSWDELNVMYQTTMDIAVKATLREQSEDDYIKFGRIAENFKLENDALRFQLQETTHNLEIAESKLKVAMEAMDKYINPPTAINNSEMEVLQWAYDIARDALAEIERLGGENV